MQLHFRIPGATGVASCTNWKPSAPTKLAVAHLIGKLEVSLPNFCLPSSSTPDKALYQIDTPWKLVHKLEANISESQVTKCGFDTVVCKSTRLTHVGLHGEID